VETIYFTKEFTDGILKGIRVFAWASFPTVAQCAEYATLGRKGKDKLGLRSRWIIVDRSFQNYQR